MFNSIFRRFGRKDSSRSDPSVDDVRFHTFTYRTVSDVRDNEFDIQAISVDRVGFNVFYSVKNYMAEPIVLNGNLSTSPNPIRSLVTDNTRQSDDNRNYVVVVIYSSEIPVSSNTTKRPQVRKTEIRIPGKMLNQGSVFIDELDCYVSTESNIDATRELIAKDTSGAKFETINVSPSMLNNDPEAIYIGYKDLVADCITRQDKIAIRIGCDIRYGVIPNIIKTMRVAILDSYFVPFKDYKLIYDPSLDEDEFVLENLRLSSRGDFRSTFSELKRLGSMYLDHTEEETLFGKFYGVALFANETAYTNYVFKRRTNERFNDETLYLAERSGDPRLKEEIENLRRDTDILNAKLTESADNAADLIAQNKELKSKLRDREETIKKIRTHHDTKMDADTVLSELEIESRKIHTEGKRIDLEQEELGHRQETSKMAHKANVMKSLSEMMKSGWAMTSAVIAGILSLVALCKKYNIKLSMGS